MTRANGLVSRLLRLLALGALLINLLPTFVAPAGVSAATVAPILILIDSATNPFSAYIQELLNAEGVKDYELRPLSNLTSSALLSGRRAVILGESSPSGTQITLLDNFVSAGGGLVAMRPAAGLNAILGVTRQTATTAEGYLRITDPTQGAGLYGDTMQFHGTSGQYTLNGAVQIAELYSGRATTTGRPAITLASRGSGKAVLFSYDLARSVALTRQGNPANGDVDTDGDGIVRSIDIYRNWADLERTSVPQADMQQRLLVRLLQTVAGQPIPRLWYFPSSAPTVVVATGDAHGAPNSYYQPQIDALRAIGAVMTFYVSTASTPEPGTMDAWEALGFDFGPHPYVDCGYACGYDNAFDWFESTYGFTPRTVRTHQVRWAGWSDAAAVEAQHGVGMDFNAYLWGPWVKTASGAPALGYLNGGGQPMRFVDASGTILPIYQQYTNLVDEFLAPSIPNGILNLPLNAGLAASYQMIDDSINGYHTPIVTQFHVDYWYPDNSTWAIQSTQYALQHGAISLTANKWLDFVQQRAATTITNSTWASNALTFTVGAGGSGQTMLLPLQSGSGTLNSVRVGSTPVTYTTMVVNGTAFAAVNVQSGNYTATYGADTTAPVVTGTTPAAGATGVSTNSPIGATFSEVMNRTSTQGAFAISPSLPGTFSWNASGTILSFAPGAPMAASTTYTVTVGTGATDLAGNPLASPQSWSFATAAITPPPSIGGVTPISGPITGGTSVAIGGAGLAGATAVSFGGTPASSFTVNSDALITAVAPARPAGTIDVTVTTPVGTSAITAADRYTFVDQATALAVTAANPGVGPATGGTTVTITGANFATGATVKFGGVAATNVTVTSTTTLTATAPAHAAGGVDIVVTNPGPQAATLAAGYRYVPCGTNCLSHTTAADFATGTAGATIAITQVADGEIELAPTMNADFGGTTLPGSWSAAPWSAGGGATVGGGVLTVNGALAATDGYYAPGRVLEFVATFDPSTGFQHGGFGVDLNSGTWAIFSTGSGGGALYARTNNGAGQVDTLLSGNWLGAPHRFRIEWTTTGTIFLIDGTQVASHTLGIQGTQRPLFSDGAVGGAALVVDWARLSPYAAAGTFTSRIFDAAGTASWGIGAWSGVVLPGTSLAVSIRTGNTPTPDGSWTAYAPLVSGATIGASARYLQYQVALATTDPGQTPTLRDLIIGYTVTGPLAPTLNSAAPAAGISTGGATVTITGTNFAAGATVTFGGTAATGVAVANSTTLTATAPAHATGAVDIVVTNPDGRSGTLPGGYLYTSAPPTVTGVSPAGGPPAGGTAVTITGTDFAGATAVAFGGVAAASFTVDSPTQISAVAPPNALGVVNVTVTTPAGTSPAATANQFSYQVLPPTPQVRRVTPGTGPETGGATVVIEGSNFTGATGVALGGAAATGVTVVSATRITAVAPAHAAGTVDVRVTTPSGTSATNPAAQYTYVPCPTACITQTTGAQFAAGTAGPGAQIALDADGEVGLAPLVGVEFGGTTLPGGWSVAPWSAGGGATVGNGVLVVDGALVHTDDYFAPGRVLEFVATFDPTAPSQHAGLGVNLNSAPWAIFSTGSGGALYARTNAAGGQADTLLPGDWLGAPHRFRIAWTGAGATYAIDGVQVAAHPLGNTGDLRPVLSDGPAGGATLTLDWLRLGPYAPAGTFTSPVLDAAGAATWQALAWTADAPAGTSLSVRVRTGDTPSPDASWTAFAPATSGATLGATGRYLQYQVALATTDPNLTPTLSDLTVGYTVTGPPAPAITGLSPASGPAAGGTVVTITGTGFTGATAVTFGGTAATSFAVTSATSITATAPARAAGASDVVVTGPNGSSIPTAASSFTYQAGVPTVTGLSPASGPVAGGTVVTITGTGFTGATGVAFGGAAATGITVVSDTSITATAPARAEGGAVNVSVTTPAGTSAPGGGNLFSYLLPAPTVNRVSPGTGPAAGGATVVIEGSNLTGATAVAFGGAAATGVTVTSATSITATAPPHAAGTVDVQVTTPSGTSATNPAARYTYVPCPTACITQTTGAQFAAGSQDNTTIVQNQDGEVALALAAGSEFSGNALPGGWSVAPWSAGGGATVGNGALVVDGALVVTNDFFAPGRVIEFVATFDRTAGFQHAGLGVDLNTGPWAIFSTGGSGGALYARTNAAGGQADTLLPGDWLGTPHRFRIAWTGAGATYAIDGVQVAAHPLGNTGDLRPVLSDGPAGGATLTLDWLRLGPYAPAGTFTSPVLDAAGAATWQALAWTADAPAGTSLTVRVRTGDTPAPDASWTAFAPATSGATLGAAGRYLQYQVALATTDPNLTPALSDLTIGYSAGGGTPPPTVTGLGPASGPAAGGTAVTITGTGFTGATAVAFGGAAATSFTVVSDTSITATAPAHAAGTAYVVVTTPAGTSAAGGPSQYTYQSPLPAPTLASVGPSSGPIDGGTVVTITGTGFTSGATVTFGGAAATNVTVASATSITATTPAHAAGGVAVVVTNPDDQTGELASGFTYQAPAAPLPTVTGLSPATGPAAGGTIVTLTGTGFTGATGVAFGGTAATGITVVSDTSITATAPARAAGNVNVVVTTPAGSSAAGSANQYTYAVPAVIPTVASVSPGSGTTAGGTAVTITGTNFAAGATVTFGGIAATAITVVSATSITATTPAHAAGAVAVAVTNPDNQSGDLANGFTYQTPAAPVPTVTGLSPATGPATGGTVVTITGTGLTGATAVSFGGAAATNVAVVSATSVTATAPAGTGVVNVTVTTPAGTSATAAANQYTYQAPPAAPTLIGLSPASGPAAGGTAVTITGTGFTGATAVSFGGTAATSFTVNSATQITATAPARAAGTIDVVVTTPAGATTPNAASKYAYQAAAPTLVGLSPASGSTTGGTTVTITGTNFTGATAVAFGPAAAASFTVNSATSITAVSPSRAAGVVDVVVTTPAGSTATGAASKFTFQAPVPAVTGLSPAVGATAGGTVVTLTGTGFTGATAVAFGTTNAPNFTVNSATSITVTAPARSSGTINVRVTTAGGQSPTASANQFTYLADPTIVFVTPNSGTTSGGTSVTIIGSNFVNGMTVTFDGIAATNVSVSGGSNMSATAPPHVAGAVTVAVTNPAGRSGSRTNAFTYQAPTPSVTGRTPTSGPTAGGTTVTITGTGLFGATAVVFGNTPATSFTVNSPTSITAVSPPRGQGTVNIRVTTAGGTSSTGAANQFTYVSGGSAPPVVANLGSAASRIATRRRARPDGGADAWL